MLAGDAGLGFGGPPMRHNKALALAFTAALVVRLWNRQPFAPEDFGHLR
jgi:hypothetical protein